MMYCQLNDSRNYIALFIVCFGQLLFFNSCEKDIQPEACFTTQSEQYTIFETVEFDNCSSETQDFLWEFGDGTTSTDPNPTHQYQQPGKYRVRLEVASENNDFQDVSLKVLEVLEPVVGLWSFESVENTCVIGPDSSVVSKNGQGQNDYLKVAREGNFRFRLGNFIDEGQWQVNASTLILADTAYLINKVDEQEMVLMRQFSAEDDSICQRIDRRFFLRRIQD